MKLSNGHREHRRLEPAGTTSHERFARATRRGHSDAETTRDPVCRMTIGKDAPHHTLDVAGVTYVFCSEGCLAEFLRHPEDYATDGST